MLICREAGPAARLIINVTSMSQNCILKRTVRAIRFRKPPCRSIGVFRVGVSGCDGFLGFLRFVHRLKITPIQVQCCIQLQLAPLQEFEPVLFAKR